MMAEEFGVKHQERTRFLEASLMVKDLIEKFGDEEYKKQHLAAL